MTNNTEKLSSRDKLIAALEAEIRKQDEIIRTQEKTIELLTQHNHELTAFLDQFSNPDRRLP